MRDYKVRVKKTGEIGFTTQEDNFNLKNSVNYFVTFMKKHKFYGTYYKQRCYYGEQIEVVK